MKEKNIILSIIIPVYNTGALLKETIESIRQVNFSYPYEVILINDGSTDQVTLKLLDTYRSEFKVLDKDNGGISSARNLGISQAEGKYILPFDGDDLMYKNHYDLALRKMVKNETIDIIYGDYQVFGRENRYNRPGKYNRLRLIYSGNYVSSSNMYKKEVWIKNNGYDETVFYAEDWDFWSRAAVSGFHFEYFPKLLFKYRKAVQRNSLSDTKKYSLKINSIQTIKNNIPSSVFNHETISDYVVTSLQQNNKLKIKLFIRVFFPKLFNYLLKKGYFPNKIVVD